MDHLAKALKLSLDNVDVTAAAMIEFYVGIPDIAELEPRPIEMIKQVYDYLFFSMLENYQIMSSRYKVSGVGVMTPAMSIYINCASLIVLAGVELVVEISPEVIALGLVYTQSPHCTLEELLNTLWLINVRWHMLCLSDDKTVLAIYDYLLSLVRRSFYFVAAELAPEDIGIVDAHLIDGIKVSQATVRRLCETLCRLLCEIRVFFIPKKDVSEYAQMDETKIAAMNAQLKKAIDELVEIATIRQELREMLECSSVTPIDFPLFVERVRTEPYDLTIMPMLARVTGFASTQGTFIACVDIRMLFAIKEADAEKYSMFTENERAAAQVMKLHAAEMYLKKGGVEFRGDYVTLPAYIVSTIHETMQDKTPTIISLIGMYHVIFRKHLILCPLGIEQAIHVWNSIVLNVLDGNLSRPKQAIDAIKLMYKTSGDQDSSSKWSRKVKI